MLDKIVGICYNKEYSRKFGFSAKRTERFVETLSQNNNRILENDFITNKLITVLCTACIYAIIVMAIRGWYDTSAFRFIYTGTKVLMFVALAGVAFGIWKAVSDKKKNDGKKRIFSGAFIAVCSAILAYICYRMAYTNYISAAKFLYVLIAAITILYLIYMIYKREYFVLALFGIAAAIYIWRFARGAAGTAGFIIAQIVFLAVLAAVIALVAVMYKNGGTVTLGKTTYRFMNIDAEYKPTLIGLSIIALLIAALFVVPVGAMIYLAYAAAVLVFAYAVYFTVIMM